MNLAIFHYHFNRGGVTQVVLNQLRAIDAVLAGKNRLPVALVHGGRSEGIADEQLRGFQSIELSTHAIAALDYDDGTPVRDEQLAAEIRGVLAQADFATGETLLHVHNHALGKNVSLPGAIRRLAEFGFHCLLQIHDFAEDLRPANYRRLSESLAAGDGDQLAAILYPQATHIHYAVLNGRDYGVLQQSQIVEDRLHLLPNSVAEFGEFPSRESARDKLHERFGVQPGARFVVYPVRGIRRKNVGEMLLWSALGSGQTICAMTLGPLNPVERTSYQRWTRLADELRLPCLFEIGAPGGLQFKENLAAADRLLTTSIAEGFGMVFLEAWLAGRNLVGRDLPEITTDFVNAGISLDQMYAQLLIPIEWIGRDALCGSLAMAYVSLLGDYGVQIPPPSEVRQRLSALLQQENVDFALLNSDQQSQVIRRVHEDASARRQILDLNPLVAAALDENSSEPRVAQNAEVVRRTYSAVASGCRLLDLYERVATSPIDTEFNRLPDAGRILGAFLDVSRLHPIRFES